MGTSPRATGENPRATGKNPRKVKGADLPPPSEFFERAWENYPRKVAKGEAWRAFSDLDAAGKIPDDIADRIAYRALDDDWNFRKDPSRKQYIPHMATWLRANGWEDEGCFPEHDPRNPPPEVQAVFDKIMAKYDFSIHAGNINVDFLARQREMEAELEATGLWPWDPYR
jgi:hypothetical protein